MNLSELNVKEDAKATIVVLAGGSELADGGHLAIMFNSDGYIKRIDDFISLI